MLILAEQVKSTIINEIKNAKYFSISVDSTPDISHVDQLTIIVRYLKDDIIVERFITFVEIHSHTGLDLTNVLL